MRLVNTGRQPQKDFIGDDIISSYSGENLGLIPSSCCQSQSTETGPSAHCIHNHPFTNNYIAIKMHLVFIATDPSNKICLNGMNIQLILNGPTRGFVSEGQGCRSKDRLQALQVSVSCHNNHN